MDHKWHVHVNPEGNDTYAEMGPRCKSLGGQYNPYLVDLAVSIMALGRQSMWKKQNLSMELPLILRRKNDGGTLRT